MNYLVHQIRNHCLDSIQGVEKRAFLLLSAIMSRCVPQTPLRSLYPFCSDVHLLCGSSAYVRRSCRCDPLPCRALGRNGWVGSV